LWWQTLAGIGERLDSAELKHRPAPSPGPELRGFLRWADVVDRYDGGLAVAMLRPT
jgi:hypothetical protein